MSKSESLTPLQIAQKQHADAIRVHNQRMIEEHEALIREVRPAVERGEMTHEQVDALRNERVGPHEEHWRRVTAASEARMGTILAVLDN